MKAGCPESIARAAYSRQTSAVFAQILVNFVRASRNILSPDSPTALFRRFTTAGWKGVQGTFAIIGLGKRKVHV